MGRTIVRYGGHAPQTTAQPSAQHDDDNVQARIDAVLREAPVVNDDVLVRHYTALGVCSSRSDDDDAGRLRAVCGVAPSRDDFARMRYRDWAPP